MTQAAIYCRSSKDRAEVGLAAQRAELKAFAKAKGLAIVAEFSDMEISGSLDETSRPGLRNMLAALADPAREWKCILALDTSRIARDLTVSLFVTREAEKHGVAIEYAKMPVDGSSAIGEMLLTNLRAFDRLHARLSADKGRSGLTANIAKGFRAGGAAPFGYKLKHSETGAVRGGQPVRKSTLVLDPAPAAKVKAFLRARAAGVPRSEAAKRAKLHGKAAASLIAFERNALTYAGFTVWNMRRKHRPTREDSRKTMLWRPRSEWTISESPTHDPLISRTDAERILSAVDVANPKPRGPRVCEPDRFILSGLLFTPDGKQWHGDAHDRAYRAGIKGRRINAAFVEGQVLQRIVTDFADRRFLARTVAEARRMAEGIETDPLALDTDLKRTEKRLANLIDIAAESGERSLLAKIRELESSLASQRDQRAAWAERKALKERLSSLSEDDVIWLLRSHEAWLSTGSKAFVELMAGYSVDHDLLKPDQLRRVLTTLIERIELDPATRAFAIRYRLPVPENRATGARVASPRGFEPRFSP